jgi:TPR repeat protein
MPLLRTSFLAAVPALLLLSVSGCDTSTITAQDAVMSLAKTAVQQPVSVLTQALPQESCNGRARFVPGIGCEQRRPAMAEPALDEPTCEVGSLDRCLNDCEGGGALSCSVLGKMYREGIGVRRDARVAQKWQRRACALGSIEGCEDPSKS